MSHPHPELELPGPLADGGVRVVPLGGLGEVGRNMTVVEHRGQLLDHRLRRALPRRPPPRHRPDPPGLRVHRGPARRRPGDHPHPRPRGPHRRRALPAAPQAGPPARRLHADPGARRGQAQGAPDHAVHARRSREGDREKLGVFDCEFVAVNHSIPDALAVAVRTSGGTLLHTGDFKMDQLPLDGRLTDLRAFARLGEEGVDLFLTDSTNAEVPGLHHARARHLLGDRQGVPRTPSAGSSWPASPRTCTACSRCSTPPRRPAARSPWWAARWCATWASPPTSATSTCPTACSSTSRSSTTSPTTRSCSSAPAARASRWPPCRGWPTATTASTSAPATPCCWRPR